LQGRAEWLFPFLFLLIGDFMKIKSSISRLLRKLNLLSPAEKVRFRIQKLKYKRYNDAFKKEYPGVALPPENFIYETYRLNFKWYYEDGKNSAIEIVELFSRHYDFSNPGIRVLDWGCGPGRIVRHLPILLPGAEIYGTDYNEEYIKWCNDNLKGISFFLNSISPPMNFNSSYFFGIIGLSVFTHLSEKNHFKWINELHRITEFGGAVLITTQGHAYYSKLTKTEKYLFDSKQLVVREYINEGNRLYSSFQPKDFMELLIAGKFAVVEYLPGKVTNNEPSQDTWLLRKI
jgi:SAM-dependent methyltransferase